MIDLSKGQKLDLSKDGRDLDNVCVGVNWGAIESKGFFGSSKKAVDLDASALIFDENGNLLDKVWYRNLATMGRAIAHSGDDLTGDLDGDDGLDNEVIQINLKELPDSVHSIVIVLHSFSGQDFSQLPFASVRIYEGTPDRVDSLFATYKIATDNSYAGKVAAVLGKIYKRNGVWKFASIGDAVSDRKLEETVNTVKQSYL